ncbi:MAG: hypothetical protein GY838_15280 [bacterium]|nr:hypothetical protein [bacterium]
MLPRAITVSANRKVMGLAVVACCCLTACSNTPLSTERTLARIRQAVGITVSGSAGAGFPGVVEARGTIRRAGEEGSYRLVFDASGSIREEARLRLGFTVVLRDSQGWSLDSLGDSRKLLLGELEQTRLWLGILTNRWLDHDAGFETAVASASAGKVALTVGLSGGLRPATVIVDTLTWLPASFSYPTDAGLTTWRLEDYRAVAGRQLAHRAVRDWDGADQYLELDAAVVFADVADSVFAVTRQQLTDHGFDPLLPPEVETRILDTGHVLVRPVIDGRESGWFILDTGADAHVISPRMADSLGLVAFGDYEATGTGGTVRIAMRQAARIRVGPLTMENPILAEIDLSGIIPGVEGIIGYPLFRRAVVEINPAGSGLPVRVFPLGGYPEEVPVWHDLLLVGRHPFVVCGFEGENEGLFLLDTGHRLAATFSTRAVDQLGLLRKRKTWKASGSGGVGGQAKKRRGKIEWIEIGGVRFIGPTVDFSRAVHGGFSNPYREGTVGMGLLCRFRLVIDYANGRMAFVHRES